MRNGNEVIIEQIPFMILDLLGSGSYGQVYRGVNKFTNQTVAIKIQENINENELQVLKEMKGKKYKNLINILNFQKVDKCYYIVMEFCKESLYDQMQRTGTIKPDDVRYIMREIANGLHEIHNLLGYAHRDIKPENILICQKSASGVIQEIYKICDFGTIKRVNVLQTQTIGTAYYRAPEQLNGSKNYTTKVDIWAFGAVIYELLTGYPLFNGQTERDVAYKILKITQQEIDTIIQNNLKIERRYIALLQKMLQINVGQRCTIDEVVNQLRSQSNIVYRDQLQFNNQNKGQPLSQPIFPQKKNNLPVQNLQQNPSPFIYLPKPNIQNVQTSNKFEILPHPKEIQEKQQQNYIQLQQKNSDKQQQIVRNSLAQNSSTQLSNDKHESQYDDSYNTFEHDNQGIAEVKKINLKNDCASGFIKDQQKNQLAKNQIEQNKINLQQQQPQQQLRNTLQQNPKSQYTENINNNQLVQNQNLQIRNSVSQQQKQPSQQFQQNQQNNNNQSQNQSSNYAKNTSQQNPNSQYTLNTSNNQQFQNQPQQNRNNYFQQQQQQQQFQLNQQINNPKQHKQVSQSVQNYKQFSNQGPQDDKQISFNNKQNFSQQKQDFQAFQNNNAQKNYAQNNQGQNNYAQNNQAQNNYVQNNQAQNNNAQNNQTYNNQTRVNPRIKQ